MAPRHGAARRDAERKQRRQGRTALTSSAPVNPAAGGDAPATGNPSSAGDHSGGGGETASQSDLRSGSGKPSSPNEAEGPNEDSRADVEMGEANTSSQNPQKDPKGAPSGQKERTQRARQILKDNDESVLGQIPWSHVANPGLPLADRVAQAEAAVQARYASDEFKAWKDLSAAEKVCAQCHRPHPPPCLSATELDLVEVKRQLLGSYKRDLKGGEKKGEEAKEGPPPLCKNCAKLHRGSCSLYKCRRCGRGHRGNVSCAATKRLFIDAGLLDEEEDEKLDNFATFLSSATKTQAQMANKVFEKMFSGSKQNPGGPKGPPKRKDPPGGSGGHGGSKRSKT